MSMAIDSRSVDKREMDFIAMDEDECLESSVDLASSRLFQNQKSLVFYGTDFFSFFFFFKNDLI